MMKLTANRVKEGDRMWTEFRYYVCGYHKDRDWLDQMGSHGSYKKVPSQLKRPFRQEKLSYKSTTFDTRPPPTWS
jgi:hypothetical protein